MDMQGEKKRDAGGPNEIVACTNCGGGSAPCTHSANNGCATEVSFVYLIVTISILFSPSHGNSNNKFKKNDRKNQIINYCSLYILIHNYKFEITQSNSIELK